MAVASTAHLWRPKTSVDLARGPLGVQPSLLATSGLIKASLAWRGRQRRLWWGWPLEATSSLLLKGRGLHRTQCWRGQRLSCRQLSWERKRETRSSGSRSVTAHRGFVSGPRVGGRCVCNRGSRGSDGAEPAQLPPVWPPSLWGTSLVSCFFSQLPELLSLPWAHTSPSCVRASVLAVPAGFSHAWALPTFSSQLKLMLFRKSVLSHTPWLPILLPQHPDFFFFFFVYSTYHILALFDLLKCIRFSNKIDKFWGFMKLLVLLISESLTLIPVPSTK